MRNKLFTFAACVASVFIALPVLILVFVLITGLGKHYRAPSASMAPTIHVGDHFYVSTIGYLFSKTKVPNHGDVIVFKNSKTDLVMVKRAMALPGDTIQVQRGRIILNRKILPRKHIERYVYRSITGRPVAVDEYQEFLPESEKQYFIREQNDTGPLDNTEIFSVPPGYVFVMGDSRDNSTDSRSQRGPGFVPIENIIGEATLTLFRSGKCVEEQDIHCPPSRAMKKL